MRIGLTELFVDRQDEALAFYTGMLGLEVKVDLDYGDGSGAARWLTVVSPEDPDGPQLLLTPADEAAAALQAARRRAGAPALSFTIGDCAATYRQLQARGVRFRSEPRRMGYGGTDAVFDDGCGNLLNLHQDG